MRINSSGNVGIGGSPATVTHNPHLDIVGNRGTLTVGTGYFEDNGTTNFLNGARPLAFGTGAAERMRITSSGNVSIGNTNNTYKLDVSGTTKTTGLLSQGGDSNAAGLTAPGVFLGGDGTNALIYGRQASTWKNTYLDSAKLFINAQSGGNVGIGTTNPLQKLDTQNIIIGGAVIAGSYRANSLLIDNNSGTSRFYSLGPNTTTKGAYVFHITSSDATINPEIMRIANTGNVGINNTNPGEKLDVTGNIKGSTTMTAGYTVSTLPTGVAAKIGMRAYVTDGTSRSWGGTVTDAGLGGAFAPVMYDGSNWKYY